VAIPGPQAITLTMTMPDPPGKINGMPGARLHCECFMQGCVVQATVQRVYDGFEKRCLGTIPWNDPLGRCLEPMSGRRWRPRAAPAGPRGECHARAIRAAYDDKMSKMTDVPRRRDRSPRDARLKELHMPYTFTLTTTIPASPEDIYEAWLDSIGHSEMTGGEATMSDEVGAEVTAWDGYVSGRNLELIPGERIVQSWRTTEFGEEDEDSIITVLLQEIEGGTLLTLEHSNVPDEHKSYEEGGWRSNYFEPMIAYFSEIKDDAGEPASDQAPPQSEPRTAPEPAPKQPAKRAAKTSAGGRSASKARRKATAGTAKRAAPRKAPPKKKSAQKTKSRSAAKARSATARKRSKSAARKPAKRRRARR
jgi:uncharacterized protein YndB with AHSA1/START domain